MHEIRSSNLTPDLIERIFRDKHLEGLFLDYLRISSSARDLKKYRISTKETKSLELIKQVALDAFLVETDRKYKIRRFNGHIPELLDFMTIRVSKKYRLDQYFNL